MNLNGTSFNLFFNDFIQQVIRDSEEDETTREDKFTEIMLDALEEADETENAVVCYHKKTGIKVNGYGMNDSGDIIDIFVSEFSGQVPSLSLPKSETEQIFRRAENFFEKCLDGYYINLEEAQPVYDLSDLIYRYSSEFRKIRFFLLTDKTTRIEEIKDKEQGDFIYTYQVWDINRYYKLFSSGNNRESITINLKEDFDSPLPCLCEGDENPIYSSYFAVIPGKTLVALYDEYGPRLLERNVRSFLQVRGKVNKGIRDTVLNNPEMFLAYNNGLSTTAESISTEILEGRTYITQIRDFQIVNGAQTTATIHDTYIKNKDSIELDFIHVPMKLTVLKDSSDLNKLVSKISEYSNTQNKIDMADFSSNHPFHVKMEELSSRVRAPSKEGIQLESYWFYERVRGQYLNKRNREGTPAKKRLFDKVYPKKQKFDKTEFPIFEHTWQMRPYNVGLGKQKNYKLFMSEMGSGKGIEPDEKYFTDTVAKAIIYKETYSIVRKELEGGYRPNITAYSIAYLNYKTGNKISLDKIWKEQDIGDDLRGVLTHLVKDIQQFIITAPKGRNVSEYCKKKECWDKLCQKNISLQGNLKEAFSANQSEVIPVSFNNNLSRPDMSGYISVNSVSPEDWEKLAIWSIETNYLSPQQRSVIKKIYSKLKGGGYCSPDLMTEAFQAVNIARDSGFTFTSEILSGNVDSEKEGESSVNPFKLNSDSFSITSDRISGITDEMIETELVRFLKKKGGKSKLLDILREFNNKWESQLTEYDLETYSSGSIRWRVRVSSMKNSFIENNILKKSTNVGMWVLNPHYESAKAPSFRIKPLSAEVERDSNGTIINTGISDEIIEEEIVNVLVKHGGAAQPSVFLSDLESIWEGMLNEVDLEKSATGSIRWRARVSSKKRSLMEKGVLDKNSPSGIWKLDQKIYDSAFQAHKDRQSANVEKSQIFKENNDIVLNKEMGNLSFIQKSIILILAESGGADNMKHVHSELLKISKSSETHPANSLIKRKQIRSEMISAKNALVKAGLVDKQVMAGKWKLTHKGMASVDVLNSVNDAGI